MSAVLEHEVVVRSKEKAERSRQIRIDYEVSNAIENGWDGDESVLRHVLQYLCVLRPPCEHGIYHDPECEIICDECWAKYEKTCAICSKSNPQYPRIDCDECRISGALNTLQKHGFTVTRPELVDMLN
jgi:hypothetical protein